MLPSLSGTQAMQQAGEVIWGQISRSALDFFILFKGLGTLGRHVQRRVERGFPHFHRRGLSGM